MIFPVRNVFVLGLGRSGMATALFCKQQGIAVTVWDDTESVREAAILKNLQVTPEPQWGNGFYYIVISPGIPVSRLALFYEQCSKENALVTCDLGLFFIMFPNAKCIGVTGTNGKSTTCSAIAHVLHSRGIKHYLAGNIGIPIFDVALNHTPDTWYILEWSSYQLELCAQQKWRQEAGGVLNLSPHHLERHQTIEAYGAIKRTLLEHSHYGVVDLSGSSYMHHVTKGLVCEHLTYITLHGSQENSISYDEQGIYDRNVELSFSSMKAFRSHAFQQNIAMAYALLKHIPNALTHFVQDIRTFKSLEHRQECFLTFRGIQCVNDSKATTPEACVQALAIWPFPLFWIAGGALQQDDLSILISALSRIKHTYVYGASAARLWEFLADHHVPCKGFHTLQEATEAAWCDAKNYKSAVILCSPACPSFDQFSDFVARGKAFKSYIRELVYFDSK